jgi:hypothetical protein
MTYVNRFKLYEIVGEEVAPEVQFQRSYSSKSCGLS